MVASETNLKSFLEQVHLSGVFGKSKRRIALLEHLIHAELNGEGDALKAYSIGLDVLGRGDDFDPSTDSIVRVEIGRLRDALNQFYATDYAAGQIKVSIPKGTYRPVIEPADAVQTPARLRRHVVLIAAGAIAALALGIGWLSVMSIARTSPQASSISLLLRSPTADTPVLANFTDELRQALSKQRTFSLLTDATGDVRSPDYELVLRAIGQPDPERISLELIDPSNASIQWAEAFPITPSFDVVALVSKATDDLFPQIISSTKDALDARPRNSLNAWELYLLSTWVPGSALSNISWEVERRDMARAAVALDPDLGQAHSVLADKLIYLSSIDANYHSKAVEIEAHRHARDALNMAPRDTNTLFNLSIHYWHTGEHRRSLEILNRIIDLDPFNGFARFLANNFEHTCVPAPDDIVRKAQAFDQQLEPGNPIRWVTLTWLGMLHLNRGELQLARDAEAQTHVIFHTPDTVMRRAVILHALGRTDDAMLLIDDEKMEWPNLDPSHFANVTMPRRCHEYPDATPLLARYADFAKAYAKR